MAPATSRAVRRLGRIAAALALIAACGLAPAPPRARSALGEPPGYGPRAVGIVPNLTAIDRLIWMPGLNRGWSPQGLAVAGDAILVSAYRSEAPWRNRGPCRVFRIDPASGVETGHFDVPAPCGHAGGLAYAGAGRLFIADTHHLFEVELAQAFAARTPRFRILSLGRRLRGGFAVSGDGAIWIGGYQERQPARAWRYESAMLRQFANGATLDAGAAAAAIAVPSWAQGGAIDRSGKLWISRSDVGWGFLDRLDATTGRLEARYPISPGIEGIAFERQGRLWAVSEEGARHFPWRHPFFPMIFRLDPARLATLP
jgi:hypothetical protein